MKIVTSIISFVLAVLHNEGHAHAHKERHVNKSVRSN